jgi:type I restriction enzyme S subunit
MNRNGWTYKKLGDICESELGKTLNHSTDTGNLYPYLCAINILWDKIDLSTLKETRFEESEIGRYTVNKGDLLICEGGDVGRAAIWLNDEPILYQNALHRVRFDDGFNTRFYLYYLKYLKESGIIDSRYSKGVTIKHLVKSSLLSIPVPIPKFETQTQIVSELDSLKDSVTMLQQQVKDLDTLALSLFYDMFGDPIENPKHWDVVKLGSISEPTIGLTYKPENVVDNDEGTVVLRSSNIQESQLAFDDIVRVNIPIKEEKYVRDGDILMCSRNGSFKLVGKVAMIKGLSEKMSYGAFMTIIRSNYNPYLFAHFKTPAFREYMNLGKTSTVNQVTVNMLKNISLPLPPANLQDIFASKIATIEGSKSLLNTQITEMQDLLASRTQYWFD